jgi:hypothetical protein
MKLAAAVAAVLFFVGAAGCGGADDDPPDNPDSAAGQPDSAAGQPDGAGQPDSAAGGASLRGAISRSTTPMGDARGNVYVALFDRDPVVDMATAQVVARALLENADLAAAGATVPYQLDGITPRGDAYFLVAFLDDNGNVDAANPDDAGPDRGDLVSLDGLAAPRVMVPAAGEVAHDIVLNSVLPF